MKREAIDVSWYHALTLGERVRLLEAARPRLNTEGMDHDLAERWQGLFANKNAFLRRIEAEGLDEAAFLNVLACPCDGLRQELSRDPAWMEDLARSLEAAGEDGELPRFLLDRATESIPFLKLIEPLIATGYQRFAEAVVELADIELADADTALPFDAGSGEIFFDNLPGRLAILPQRVLVLELNVARYSDELRGKTSEERFLSFVELLEHSPKRRQWLTEYSVLTRQVIQRIDQWRGASLEFLRHLREDWSALRECFWPDGAAGQLTSAQAGAGDSHRGGRSVMIVEFSCGRWLVYKPRPLTVERRFNELLGWLGQKGLEPALRTLRVLDRGDHGWVEFVERRDCANEAEVRRFYQRQGAFLAILYVLNANDFHFENLIAAGEHPVLVDLETLFAPRVCEDETPPGLGDLLRRSVLGPGLLPRRMRGNPEKEEGVDMSGLSPVAGQATWKPVLGIEESGTDQMHFAYGYHTFPDTHHHPVLDGSEVLACDYTEEICQGFERCYRLWLAHRNELLEASGPIRAFADSEVRVVFRATLSYALLLSESFHPDVLRDALERDLLFDHLWKCVEQQPHMARIVPAEQRDLRQLDIPLFTTRPNSRELTTSHGERLPEFFAESGLQMVERTLEGLGERDLERQLWLVHATLDTLAFARSRPPRRSPDVVVPAARGARSDALLHGADEVARRLHRLAWSDGTRATWFGFEFLAGQHWNVQPVAPDVYNGLAGIALFLAYHGAVRGDDGSTRLARQALRTLREDLEASPSLLPTVGAFNGWGGLIYSWLHLGVLLSEPTWLDEAEQIVAGLPEQIDRDESHDIVGGAAGCLVSLLELHRLRPARATLAAAVRCGERLLAQARPLEHGCGWVLESAGEKPLAGFSHGGAGIAWALLRLAAASGDGRFHDTALEAITYERSLFCESERNWPDLREGERPDQANAPSGTAGHFMCAWCHGAPGMALARLLSLPWLDDAASRREIEVALDTTRATGFYKSDCLCHGNLGNLDVLLVASDVLADRPLRREVYRRAASLLTRVGESGWFYGIPGGMAPPGLMVGLAGFGHQLLRLAAPEQVPSVLSLAAPISRF